MQGELCKVLINLSGVGAYVAEPVSIPFGYITRAAKEIRICFGLLRDWLKKSRATLSDTQQVKPKPHTIS